MELDNAMYFQSRQEWREWLEQNQDKAKEVWFIHYKKDSGKPSVSYDDAVEEALCFGWIDGLMKKIDEERFANRFSPRKAKSRWSKTNKEKAEKLINENKMAPAGLAKIEEARQSGAWDNAYATRETLEIPTDLKEALSGNKEAWNNFQRFTNYQRNSYIHHVNDARTPGTRQRRIAWVVARLSNPGGQARIAMSKKPGMI
ncbi:MAG: YdeI/OmpD-associated family protein [Chloroflexi bacterium]|nr:YdeI/OmpD-associated family protein [Chloroflexota bacterium]